MARSGRVNSRKSAAEAAEAGRGLAPDDHGLVGPGVGVALARRRKGQPGRVIAVADKAQQRLCRRFRKLAAEHKPPPKIAVAIARELAGFLWAALQPAPASVN